MSSCSVTLARAPDCVLFKLQFDFLNEVLSALTDRVLCCCEHGFVSPHASLQSWSVRGSGSQFSAGVLQLASHVALSPVMFQHIRHSYLGVLPAHSGTGCRWSSMLSHDLPLPSMRL